MAGSLAPGGPAVSRHEVITRRHLPHWYVPGAAHFVTYRLAGTIPAEVLRQLRAWHEERRRQPAPPGTTPARWRELAHKQFFARYDRYPDEHRDIDWLARPAVAALVRGNLYHHDGKKYHLLAYCIMPNHVHVLLQPVDLEQGQAEEEPGERPDASSPLARIMHSLKSYTANGANALLGRTGTFWQGESYDHWARDEDELGRIVDYIAANPVKAGLVRQPHEWFFCSAHDRFLRGGTASAWLPS
jgi:putative DNA methylase